MSQVQQLPRTRIITVSNATVVLNVGLIAAGAAVALSLLTRTTAASTSIGPVPIAVALIALMIGIPHGAVDNLTLQRSLTRSQKLAGAAAYVGIAALAAAAIITWPGIAFVLVIAMTVWHFGSGDVEAWATLTGDPVQPRGWRKALLAIAAGGAPVVLPLTSPAALTTLAALNPSLGDWWSSPATTYVRVVVLAAVVVSAVMLLHSGRPMAAVHLAILAALGIFAAPLLAFAVYFGAWHALRHTARLAEHRDGVVTWAGIGRVTLLGTPALIATVVIVAIALALTGSVSALAPGLWVGLAVVWGLTVPHMSLVEAFDRRTTRG